LVGEKVRQLGPRGHRGAWFFRCNGCATRRFATYRAGL
jgi:hypothetical protein